MVQGYEPLALTDLEQIYDNILVSFDGTVPCIEYIGTDNKCHIYHPDIFIPDENLIIEIKSEYTYSKYIADNLLKEEATLKSGFKYEIQIYDKKLGLLDRKQVDIKYSIT